MQTVDLTNVPLDSHEKDACKMELARARWGDNFTCPSCGGSKYYFLKKRVLFECANRNCRKQSSPTSQTQLHGIRKIPELFELLKAERDGIELSCKNVRLITALSFKSSKRMVARLRTKLLTKCVESTVSFFDPKQFAPTPPVVENVEPKLSVIPLQTKCSSCLNGFWSTASKSSLTVVLVHLTPQFTPHLDSMLHIAAPA